MTGLKYDRRGTRSLGLSPWSLYYYLRGHIVRGWPRLCSSLPGARKRSDRRTDIAVTSASINTRGYGGCAMTLVSRLRILFTLCTFPARLGNFCVSRGNFYRLDQIFYAASFRPATVIPAVKREQDRVTGIPPKLFPAL